MIINDRYKIVSDDLNIVLQRRNLKENGEYSNYVNIGYFTDFKVALQSFVKREILSTELKDFENVCNKIDEIMHLIRNLEVK
ncbi:Uncharacterised protein [[Clostridium] sordellii]|uniref:hypothetical protein n=1 Tax=Paraclostridium sordellii TaxID=1505 RepID=UPI0005E1D93E|nr:hypothetical protein [Paeniclostridium sordellii]CEQ01596.1 Uncharacterised protein [[Clostridium] sordellii] [Paeniclostridium sordellii]